MVAHSITALAVLACASVASASLFMTAPVSTTTCQGGSPCPVVWEDSGVAPALATYGTCQVGLYTGSVTQQTLAQDLGIVDPSKTNRLTAIIPVTAGPTGDFYFIRFTSAANTTLQAFSAKFQLTGMTGKLSPAAQAQIDGTTTPASVSSASSASSVSSSSSRASVASASSTSASRSGTSTSTAPSASGSTSGCGSLKSSTFALFGTVVAAGAAMLL